MSHSVGKAVEIADTSQEALVQRCGEIRAGVLARLLQRFGIGLQIHAPGSELPGSYWGAPEAGLVGLIVHVRPDTPVHSLLHEAGHVICMDEARRAALHTEAGGEPCEENGVCYLQILLADHVDGAGRDRLMLDMDRWGYSFRLGSTRAWFENDADDARAWLIDQGLIDSQEQIQWRLRR